MRVKICGINNRKDFITAVNMGADAVGFIVGTTHKAEDQATAETARQLICECPPLVSTVIVTHFQAADPVADIVLHTRADTVQIQSNMDENELRKLRKYLPGVKIIKTVFPDSSQLIDAAVRLSDLADAILLDSHTPDRLGGTGKTCDWNIAAEIVRTVQKPVILAGGLTPDNIREAMDRVRPFAVDVNSGIETNGIKDPKKVKAFVHAAHQFDCI